LANSRHAETPGKAASLSGKKGRKETVERNDGKKGWNERAERKGGEKTVEREGGKKGRLNFAETETVNVYIKSTVGKFPEANTSASDIL